MGRFEKDKNFINYYVEGNDKPYKFDINTGILYGIKGTAIKSTPKGLGRALETVNRNNVPSNAVMVMAYLKKYKYPTVSIAEMTQYADLFQVADKLDSIGFSLHDRWRLNEKELRFVGQNFKKFAQAFRENGELSLQEFMKSYGFEIWCKSVGLNFDNQHLPQDLKVCLYNHREYFTKEEIGYIIYFMQRGLWCFVKDDNYRVFDRIKDFFEKAKVIGHKVEKTDFLRQYEVVMTTYTTNKEKFDSASIQKQLSKHKATWNFENEELEVFVPQTTEDFKKEAEYQQNCVYNLYMKRVVEGETNVIFIRKKSNPTVPYITCEVTNGGVINQYLTRFNSCVNDEVGKRFYNEFAEHIKKTWGEIE